MPSTRSLLAPRLLAAHLAGLLAVGAAAGLSVWQYDAWQARRVAEATDLTRIEPEPVTDAIGPDDPFPGDKVGQPVVVEGSWVPGGTVYVSGREHEGTEGYWVVTPLAVGEDPDGPALPVVRGWVADLDAVPAPPTGRAALVGWLQPGEGTGEADPDPTDDVLPQLRIADVIQHVDQDLYGAYAVVADEVAPGDWPTGDRAVNDGTAGLEPADLAALPETSAFSGLRNLLYSLEWVVFGGFAAFIWWRFVRDATADPEPPAEVEDAAEEEPSGDPVRS